MPRFIKFEMGILNIKSHPHNANIYCQLFKSIFDQQELVKLRGSDWATTNYMYEVVSGKPTEGLYGEFYRFLEIDPKGTWLDLRKRKTIVDDDGKPVPQVENYKKPNTKTIDFVFYPEGHRMFFNSKAITPGLAQKMMQELCGTDKIKKKFGQIDVEIETSHEVIDKILKIPSLIKLEISISRPNGDVISGKKREYLDRMEKQGIRRLEENLTSVKTEGITPDETTIALMELATSNGKIKAVGYDEEKRIEESTDPHPLIEKETFDPSKTSLVRAMINYSSVLLSSIVSRG